MAEHFSLEDPPERRIPAVEQAPVARAADGANIFIGGIPAAEYHRLQALPRRPLKPSDVPSEPWQDAYAELELREDGAIVSRTISVELGWLDAQTGRVHWVRA